MKKQSQPNIGRHFSATDEVYRPHALIGQFLVFASALVLAMMPWTEHYWTFDGSLLVRPDFELTLLASLASLCLIFLLAHLGKREVLLRLSSGIWPWFLLKGGDGAPGRTRVSLCEMKALCDSRGNSGSVPGSHNRPIQV